MPKDTRLYATFTLDFPSHHKIACLSDAAFRAWMEMIFWSRRHLTDGFIPKRMVTDKAGASALLWPASVCFELLHNDDENPSLIEVENGYLIHDFAKHQTTRAEVEAKREVKKRAGQLGGMASGRSRREAKRSSTQAGAKQTRSKTNPETETEIHNSLPTDVGREKRVTGSRLPEGWQPPPEVVAQMRSDYPHMDFRLEHAKFIDYWHGKAGKDARKVDWNATWRNWMRRAAEQAPRNGSNTPAPANSGHDDKVNGYLAYANQPREIER